MSDKETEITIPELQILYEDVKKKLKELKAEIELYQNVLEEEK